MHADKLSAAKPQPKKREEGTTDFTDDTDKRMHLFVSSVPSVKSVVQSLVFVFRENLLAAERLEGIAMQIDIDVTDQFSRLNNCALRFGQNCLLICVDPRLSAVQFLP